MNFRNNRLGVLALGISLVALFVAFGARFDGPRGWDEARGPRFAPNAATAPEPPRAPEPPVAPQAAQRGPAGEHGPWRHGWFGDDDRAGFEHRGWPMFGPFVVLGHIARFATALLLIGLGFRLLRRSRRDQGGPPSDRPFSA